MSTLTKSQIDEFNEQGFLFVENAVSTNQLNHLRTEFNSWVEESKNHDSNYGETIDGRARFDLESGHSAEKPALRRVSSPTDISEAYFDAMSNSRMVDCIADLIGPDIKFHHSKINSKLPGAATEVKWHQDFPFTPHTNDDLVTALLFVDEVTSANGPLRVLPGSHKGEIFGLWQDGKFIGAIDNAIAEDCEAKAVSCYGPAGSVCLMHTRLLHGSSANASDCPRTLFIAVYSADDAIACSPNPVPGKHQGLVVRGSATNRVRCGNFDLQLPQKPTVDSFFDQQKARQEP